MTATALNHKIKGGKPPLSDNFIFIGLDKKTFRIIKTELLK